MKKEFTVDFDLPERKAHDNEPVSASQPGDSVVRFPENPSDYRSADFSPFYGQGFDGITEVCQRTLEMLTAESIRTGGRTLSMVTIAGSFHNGFRYFASFLSQLNSASGENLTMADLTPETISQFVHYLKHQPGEYITQKSRFTSTKSILLACHRFGLWPEVNIKLVFPSNPFPNSNRRRKGQKPLSKNEKRQVVRGLRLDMERIIGQTGPLNSYDLTICVLSIALSTSMNPTPILELLTDCVQPHPLKSNLRLLVSFKRRGLNTQVVALRKSQEISEIASVHLHAVDAIDLIVERNAEVRARYSQPHHLLVYKSESTTNRVKAIRLSTGQLRTNTAKFTSQNQMVTDDGKPLTLNVSRLRKTLLNRVWELSGQDPLMAARTGRHAPETGNAHYWEAPPEAEANMRFIGENRVNDLLEHRSVIASDRTPIASCKDTSQGHRAPKNGSLCQDYLGCFRCKSFVVTGDDLYRLFSFYWAAVRGHNSFGGKRWTKYLRQVIRLIDEEIAPDFDDVLVDAQRQKAKTNPHPFWRDLSMARLAV